MKRGFRPHLTVNSLPYGATIGTSSTRRGAQQTERPSDMKVLPLRGNVGTRLKKLADQGELDGIVLAAAGLDRLQFRVSPSGILQGDGVPPGLAATYLSLTEVLPCVGQGAIAIEVREADERMNTLCAKLNHPATYACITAERAFLAQMGGGCHAPVAAYGQVQDLEVWLRAASFVGSHPRRAEGRRPLHEAHSLGKQLAAELSA
jgi:hydroxymethylbilane synthase